MLVLVGVSLAYGLTVEWAKHGFYRRQDRRRRQGRG